MSVKRYTKQTPKLQIVYAAINQSINQSSTLHNSVKQSPPFWQSAFFVKLGSWEYWPTYIVYAPAVFFWLYFAIRSKKLFFFSTVNLVIETGGVFGESKIDILNRIPKKILPKTVFISKEKNTLNYILNEIRLAEISFPLIAKPDIGERGFLVEKINNEVELSAYIKAIKVSFIIQELIDYPVELSILYHRMPDAAKGKITSICIKKTLSVIGDGLSTIETLMQNIPRARLQIPRFRKQYPTVLMDIPGRGKVIELEPIANHCRGTTFLNGNQHIDTQLEKIFDKIVFQMTDIYYGRFDLKCQSIEKLKEGKDYKILEFNGVAGEPAHIYDPDYPILKAYRDLYQHFKIIYKIGRQQSRKGVPSMTLKALIQSYRIYADYLRNAKVEAES